MKKMKKVCIIGVGMIGGSIGLALKKNKLADRVVGIGRNPEKLKKAKLLKAIDEWDTDLEKGLKGAELVFIAIPAGLIPSMADKAAAFLGKNAIITDAGSVKSQLVRKTEKMLANKVHFVGVHPIAGSETSGVENAKPDLFKDTACIITPTDKTNKKAFSLIRRIWQKMGAKVFVVSAEKHDKILAFTSHLPHLVSVSLMQTYNMLNKSEELSDDFVGPGFLDTTRIASGSPEMWKDICLENSPAILKALGDFKKNILLLENVIKAKKWKTLLRDLSKAKIVRDRLKKKRKK